MYKNTSKKTLISILELELVKHKLVTHYRRGRKTIVRKEKAIAFILVEKELANVYRGMELEGEAYLPHKYDHSTYQYHYSQLDLCVLAKISDIFSEKCKHLLNEILLHIADSTALSTSVRVSRIRAGTRCKEKLTDKFHTILGYDPPNKIVIVEDTLASDHHLSDGKGAEKMVKNTKKKGFLFGDSAYETYDLIELACSEGLFPVIKPTKKGVRKKLSAKARLRKCWNGNPRRLYKEIRGIGEVLYGASTRANLIHTKSVNKGNRRKDSLILAIRQNMFSYLRLKFISYFLDKLCNITIFIYYLTLPKY